MLQLYLSDPDVTSHPLAQALSMLGLDYERLDISTDLVAQAQLLVATRSTRTPALVFEDGSYLVEPTPEAFTAKLLTLMPPEPASSAGQAEISHTEASADLPASSALGHWLAVGAALALGLLAFAFGVFLGRAFASPRLSAFVAVGGIAVIGCGILALLPPAKRRLAALDRHTLWRTAQKASVPLFAALLGLSLGVRPSSFDLWPWLAMSVVLLATTLVAAGFSRPVWSRWADSLGRAQRWLGLAGVVGFLALLAAANVFGQPILPRSLVIAQLVLLALMLGLGSLPVVTAERASKAAQRAAGVLLPALGLVVIIALL